MRPLLQALTIGLLLAVATPASSEEEGWGYALANELMSPYCPGRALTECPSPQAGELREWILEQERAGVSREDVEAELFGTYGDQLLQAPRAEGLGLLAYAMPAALFLLGGVVVFAFLRRQRSADAEPAGASAAPGPTAAVAALDDEIAAEVDAAIAAELEEGRA